MSTRSRTLVVLLFVLIALFSLQRWSGRLSSFANGPAVPTLSLDPSCKYDQPSFSSNNRIVLYYAPWCDFCATFIPEFLKTSGQTTADVCFVTVNVEAQDASSTCRQVKHVQMFPTVQLEVGSDPTPRSVYSGVRTTDGLLAWVKTLDV